MDILNEAIKKQSRLLADIEFIDACDIVMGDDGFRAVPDEMIGKRRLDVGMEHRPRRWWGLLTKLNLEEGRRENAEKKSSD